MARGSIAFLLMLAANPLSIGPVVFLLNSEPGEWAFNSYGPEQGQFSGLTPDQLYDREDEGSHESV